jgi:enamine deaminase RidA (YjgF/YER057c/UK114 family)
MSAADKYAEWIVSNADKKGTPEFDTVSRAYQDLKLNAQPEQSFSPTQMLINAPASLYKNTIGGLYEMATSPVKTATGLLDIGAGALQNITPKPLRDFINRADVGGPLLDPAAAQRAQAVAGAFGQDYATTYGTGEGFKKTMQEDPFRVLGDVSLLATGGASAATKAPAVANALSRAAAITNPMNALTKSASLAGRYTPEVAANVLGLATGVGPETVKTAFQSGLRGAEAFKENIRGMVDKTDVLDQARQALQNMRADKSVNYQIGIGTTAADATKLKFQPIDDALTTITDTLKQDGHWKIGAQEVAKVDEVAKIIKEWRDDPAAHTAIGLDSLKQRLDAVYPEMGQKQAQRVITNVRNAVKDTIVNQSPEYAKTMAAYEQAISLEKEIERALSLGKNSSADTALRKLTSLARNNVNANYGYRLDLAKALEQQGGRDLLPAIAGQSMSSTLPRGLAGQGAGLGAMGATISGMSPATLLALPFMSPRLVGEAAYGAGDVARRIGQSNAVQNYLSPTIANANRLVSQVPMTAEQARTAALVAAQAGQTPYRLDLRNMAP